MKVPIVRPRGPAGALPRLAALSASLACAGGAPADDFAREVRPILSDRCFACHGPDGSERQAELRLDTREGLFRVLEGRAVVTPGRPEESHLYRRITAADPAERMPPVETGKPLGPEEIGRIRDWIAGGAAWKEHWAYRAPERPELPSVENDGWARNEIDRFILARLEEEGLSPEPEADRHTLIRRVTLDLTGLPPTPEEADAFARDDAPDAYEKVVDRLLASPHHAEHRARFWLDAARYGDTHGLHLDNIRIMWPYRDWVIRAFDSNMPYDRFTIEQIAGDLLPGATLDQQVASGFNRCHVTTSEGGVIEEEVYVRNVIDRVDTTATVLLGTTAGCAVCHDHKYDPLTAKEYYQLFAFFNSLDESPLDGNAAVYPPSVKVPSREETERIAKLRAGIAALEREIREKALAWDYEEPAAEGRGPPAPEEVVWIDDDPPAGSRPGGLEWAAEPVLSGKRSLALEAKGLRQHVFEGAKEPILIGAGDALFAHVRLDPEDPPEEIMLQWNDGSWEHRAYWGEDRIDWGAAGSPSRRPMGPLPEPGKWARLEVDAADVGLAPGAKVGGWAFTQFGGRAHWDRAGVVTRDPGRLAFDSYAAWLEALRAARAASVPKEILELARLEPGNLESDGERKLRGHFIEHVFTGSRATFAPLHEKLAGLRKDLKKAEDALPTTLVSRERAEPRGAFILKRGQYDQRGEKVERATPSFLPPMSSDLPRDRLGFARWLFDPSHPLTARVAANRFWQQVFGVGIVRTAEDFGSQGEPPSHPELLDWLAVELAAPVSPHGPAPWDVKSFTKRLVLSATYRQSSRVAPEKLSRDPENRLLSRGPRYRLDAEVIRDQALAASGLLVRTIGGPSVKPPQPAGLWEAVGYSSSNTAKFAPDTGEKVHRRSLYTFWKRTSPPPQMTTFDAPSREACRVRRERTNTPLQALQLMNETQAVEAARALAERALREAGPRAEDVASRMFRLAATRPPDAADLADLVGLYRAQLADFRGIPAGARALISIGETKPDPALDPLELAAWTMAANLVLNLDEVISKG